MPRCGMHLRELSAIGLNLTGGVWSIAAGKLRSAINAASAHWYIARARSHSKRRNFSYFYDG